MKKIWRTSHPKIKRSLKRNMAKIMTDFMNHIVNKSLSVPNDSFLKVNTTIQIPFTLQTNTF